MFILSKHRGSTGKFLILSEYLCRESALKEIKETGISIEGGAEILYEFLAVNPNIILYQRATGLEIDMKTAVYIHRPSFAEMLETAAEIVNTKQGYWIIMNVIPSACNALIAPLENIRDEDDYRLTKKAIRYHTITNILKEL